MEFRVADPGAPPASDLIAAMVEEMVPLYGRIDVPQAPSASASDFSPPGGVFLVGFDGGRAICGGGVKRLGDGAAEIKRMYVVPSARGRGVAGELLAALEDAARSLGYAVARLDTGAKQPWAERRATARSRTSTATRSRRSSARRRCRDRATRRAPRTAALGGAANRLRRCSPPR
jgi:GNAT superfamily N-acetyltransferase